MAIKNKIARTIFLKIGDFISGTSVSDDLNFLLDSQWWSRDMIDEYQNKKLRLLIEHSYSTVPYYNKLFKKIGIKVSDIQNKEDLVKIPILNKSIIKSLGIKEFTSTKIPQRHIINASSSGSTGEPLFYYNTKSAYSMNIAANLRGWYWTSSYQLGDRYVKLSGNKRTIFFKRIQDKISNNLYLNMDPLIDSNFDYILTQIEKFKPKVLRSYPDPLLLLARYKKTHPFFTYVPEVILTTGNILHPEIRAEIESIFGCEIFDSYSCEGNSNVFECENHKTYHSCEEYGISEIINNNGELINNGIGNLISTDLHNLAHPFIRYNTQDKVEIDSDPCPCGRNLLSINRIIGRDNDVITSDTGQKFIVHNFTIFFSDNNSTLNQSVEHFQIVKTKQKKIIINLLVNDNYNIDVEKFIISHWYSQLKYPVTINIVDKIPLTKSGKHKFIINE